jgi:hypothetical protein
MAAEAPEKIKYFGRWNEMGNVRDGNMPPPMREACPAGRRVVHCADGDAAQNLDAALLLQ